MQSSAHTVFYLGFFSLGGKLAGRLATLIVLLAENFFGEGGSWKSLGGGKAFPLPPPSQIEPVGLCID